MRLRNAQRWVGCTLGLLLLWSVQVFAQHSHSVAASNISDVKAKPAAPAPVPLNDLITEALERNPEIKAMQRSFDMMRARVPQAKALPEPMLSYGYAGNAPLPPFDIQKGDPASARTLSFTQELPFPGKLAIKGKMANVAAEAEWWNYEQVRLNVVAEVKDAYFDLYYLYKATETIEKNKELLEKFVKIAEASYSVGKGIQQDVLKAQVEVSKLVDQLTVLEQRKQTAEARLNSLLFREMERHWAGRKRSSHASSHTV